MDDRAFWLSIRRLLIEVVRRIEQRYELEPSKKSTH